MAKTPLVVLGDYAWDVLIRTNSKLLPGGDTFGEVMLAPGGSAANVAVWAHRCGLETVFVGKIGRDKFGQLAEDDLKGEKLEAYFIHTDAHLTGSVAVWIDETGERSMVSGKGADHYLLPSELPVKRLQNAQHLHLSAWSFFANPPRAAAKRAATLIHEAGGTISFDPGSFQLIGDMGVKAFLDITQDMSIDLLLPNYDEGKILTGKKNPHDIAQKLSELYPEALIALKLDADGSLILDKGRITEIPAGSNRLIDATGAGDSYAGAFLAKFLSGSTAVHAAKFATRISAWVTEHLGARPKADSALRGILRNANGATKSVK
ncbi:MAG: carbohydrate kinase family protein [Trueperaceae bacterium]